MTKPKVFRLPNHIISNTTLDYSAKRVAAVLYRNKNHLGAYRKSLTGLSQLCRLSVPTVQKALAELERAGYISRRRSYAYDHACKRVVYGQSIYTCLLSCRRDYTRVSCALLRQDITPACFSIVLYLYQQMGNRGRAWPSISSIAKTLAVGRATVCRALAVCRSAGLLLVQRCRKQNRAFTSSSYFRLTNAARAAVGALRAGRAALVRMVTSLTTLRADAVGRAGFLLHHQYKAGTKRAQAPFDEGGSLIFCKPSRLKITRVRYK